jgi:hypothetical protein
MHFAYHIIKSSFVGNTIYPLNKLKMLYPEIASKASEKYIGREEVTESIVYSPEIHNNFNWGDEILNWGDVSFFTLHNPALVFQTFIELNIPIKKKWRIAKIPLENFSERKIVWTHESSFTNVLPAENCLSVDEFFRLNNLESIPEKAKNYYTETYFKKGKQPLLYAYIPHLLTPDPVSFSEADIFEIELG